MDDKGRKQTNNALWNVGGGLGKTVVFGHFMTGDTVDATSDSGDGPLGKRNRENSSGKPQSREVARPQDGRAVQ